MSKTHACLSRLTALLLLGCADAPATAPLGIDGPQRSREEYRRRAPHPRRLATPSFSATSEWDVVSFPFEVAPYLDCLDETLTWTGTVTFTDHWVTNNNVVHLNSKADLEPGSTMVGPVSGTWANPEVRSHNGGTGDDFRVFERITWTSESTGSVMDVDTRIQIVIGGNGELRLLMEQNTCRLR